MALEYEEPKPAAPAPDPAPAPAPAPDPQPNLDVLLEAERQKTRAAEERAAQNQREYDSRLQQLATVLRERFEGRNAPTPDPDVQDDDFLTPEGARKAAQRLAEQAAAKAAQSVDSTYRGTVTQLLSDQFDSKLEALRSRPRYKYVKDEMEATIQANPNLRLNPKSLDILYNQFIATKIDAVLEAERKAEPDPPMPSSIPRGGVSPVSSRTAPVSPTGNLPNEDQTVELSEIEENARRTWARHGVDISPERWQELRDHVIPASGNIPDMPTRR